MLLNWHKKGIGSLTYVMYWTIWIVFVAIILLSLVKIPTSMLEKATQPLELDAAIMAERLFQKTNKFSPVLGVETDILTDKKLNQSLVLYLSDKKLGYRVWVPGDEHTAYKEFYEDAIVLAPIVYDRFITHKEKKIDGKKVIVTVDQVYPKQYQVRRAKI